MEKYTSKELSKKLADNGCKLESEPCWANVEWYEHGDGDGEWRISDKHIFLEEIPQPYHRQAYPEYERDWRKKIKIYPAYDILNDICVKYAKEMFGSHRYEICIEILASMMAGKKEEAEDYIWEHCKFNPKNQQKEK